MTKCYVLGAGFSNAVAGLPPMKKLAATFQEVQQKQEDFRHDNRAFWGKQLLGQLDHFQHYFFEEPCLGPGEQYTWCNFKENFEAIVSFVDLNLASTIEAHVVDGQGKPFERSKDCAFWPGPDLKELRRYIETYLYLALIGPHPVSPVLKEFVNSLSEGDAVVTFNYDLILDCELWNLKMWNPRDGYGVPLSSDQISQAAKFPTKVNIYKLHGSLNWTTLGKSVKLSHFYDDGCPIFPGYLADESPPPYLYQGGHEPRWIMPSFVKNFVEFPELLTVWERARVAIQTSDEVIVIGYSLPEADGAACLMLGAACLGGKKLTIVDHNVDGLLDRFKAITGAGDVAPFNDVTEYLRQRC
jgi:hypothetical protein